MDNNGDLSMLKLDRRRHLGLITELGLIIGYIVLLSASQSS